MNHQKTTDVITLKNVVWDQVRCKREERNQETKEEKSAWCLQLWGKS